MTSPTRPSRRFRLSLGVVAGTAVLAAAACAPADEESTDPGADAAVECAPDQLPTLTEGTLTIGTDSPAYPPWFVDDDPSNGEGFESAVAHAVAERLGYTDEQIAWNVVTFNNAIQPGPKEYDFDINQFSITDERRAAVDFSSPYYDVRQTVIAIEGTEAADAASLADLAGLSLGAQVGTTSYDAMVETVAPDEEPQVFNNNDDAKQALENGQVDALVLDLPTAFYVTSAEMEDAVIVGQLPATDADTEQFGLVLDLDSPLTDCVTEAVDALREDGTLAELEQEWLSEAADVPELA
ncbi:amino acid ABC transporter substrate-binding protein (PAAT family) [Nocardiopsis sp. Huas11]|uniref:ABC transporter substrate-binding protein n=1 Tax=Nocardiopsis sp. Huas11 TaxID=2183912 RepID=UPI000EB2B3C2|nr:ABC transporter substrate-binding protein [Nocardiopsis sp. Huas11]RKS05822.1 amino acid ABC transporter substrate-binding protein (PAAT family) [Nocardiopsis sp. Huas11]